MKKINKMILGIIILLVLLLGYDFLANAQMHWGNRSLEIVDGIIEVDDEEIKEDQGITNEHGNSVTTNRNQDNASAMEAEDVEFYVNLNVDHIWLGEDKTSIKMAIFDELACYFPNLSAEGWRITGEENGNYVAEFYGRIGDNYYGIEPAYTGKFILRPDFSIEVMEDTIELNSQNNFCVYATGETYAYQGYRIEECKGTYYDEERNIHLNVSLPILYSMGDEWDDINLNIWEGLEEWFKNVTDYRQGTLTLDYEIKTLDMHLFSIFFYGKYENDREEENVAMGITISMPYEKRLPQSMFIINGNEELYYDYYVEDNTLYSIINEKEDWKAVENGHAEPRYYDMSRLERHVYNENGVWLGNCYYEIPTIGTYSEEEKEVSRQIRADMGSFFNELAVRFEKIVLLLGGNIEYASEEDYATILDGPGSGYHCYVDTEITHNNEGIFEITYYYTVYLGGVIHETGEAVAAYDLSTGKVLEHQDWQSTFLKEMDSYIKLEENK